MFGQTFLSVPLHRNTDLAHSSIDIWSDELWDTSTASDVQNGLEWVKDNIRFNEKPRDNCKSRETQYLLLSQMYVWV